MIHVFAKNDSLLSYAIDFDIERREADAALQKKHRQKHASLSMSFAAVQTMIVRREQINKVQGRDTDLMLC